jgi:Arc/MetJ family transcription regulator
MRANIVINEELMEEALKYSLNVSTEKELIEIALEEYVRNRKRKNLKELKGKIKFSDDYNYKLMREK